MIKRKTYGVGYNTGGKYKVKEHGRHTAAYRTWRNMFQRCYSEYQLARRPTYIGCSVDEAFHDYQDFAAWYYNNKYSDIGFELDKDLLVIGNKIYSPDTCCFVPMQINVIFTNRAACRGSYPQGVTLSKRNSNFVARLMVNGKKKHLGCFDTPEEAFKVYKKAKEAHVKDMANLWFGNIEPRVYGALMDWKLES